MELRTETFEAGLTGELADERTAGWLQATNFGFHDSAFADPAHQAAYALSYRADGRRLTGVYDDAQGPLQWGPQVPVATYATFRKSINVGAGRLLEACLVTSVTVRPTHRRQGILRRLITGDLRRAKADGLALAALTASEATIYGRFGFGAAAHIHRVQVDTGAGFRLAGGPEEGRVEVVQPDKLVDTAAEVFAAFHARTTGSVDRQYAYGQRASGRWGRHRPDADPAVRCAVYYDPAGLAQGYVSYTFRGWGTEPAAMAVRDLIAATPEAERGLWGYLGSLDLVRRIDWDTAPVDAMLPWALQDPRGYAVTGGEDALWLRVLDPAAALRARPYAADGTAVLQIEDPLGLAAGTFRLSARGGTAEVTQVAEGTEGAGSTGEGAADLRLGAADLASLYLGGTTVGVLAAAGRLTVRAGADPAALDRLFATPRRPYCVTHF